MQRDFYDRPCLTVARELIGKVLCRRIGRRVLAGRIVETEAYVGEEDLACHAARGETPRNRVMYGPPGHAYVYLIYGIHHCFNVVCERVGFPAAVLVRALEPLGPPGIVDGTDGPGKLCRALAIQRAESGLDLTRRRGLWIEERGLAPARIATTPRIGVDYAGEWAARPWRFIDPASNWLSLPRRRRPAPRPA